MTEARPINCADYERLAEERAEPGYWGYVVGGAGDEITLRDNVEAFRRRVLRPRMLVDVSAVSARTWVLGTEIAMPLMVAPTSLQRVAHADGEPALARAAAAVGTVYTLSSLGSVRPRELSDALGDDALRSLAAGGEEGARHVLELFQAEIELALLLLGCPTSADVGPQHVGPRG